MPPTSQLWRPWAVGALAALAAFHAVSQLDPLAPKLALTLIEPPPAPPRPWPAAFCSEQQLQSWLLEGDAVALDLRGPRAYRQGHLPGARLLAQQLPTSEAQDLQATLAGLGLSGRERVVLYGDPADLPRLGQAFWLLEWAGVERLCVLAGGFDGWYLSGGAVETNDPWFNRVRFELPPRAEAVASLEWLRGRFGTAGTEVLDVRDASSWSRPGYDAPPLFAAGHIPMSSPAGLAGWVENGWPAAEEVWQRLLELGPRPSSFLDLSGELVLYGHDAEDPWAGVGYLLLRSVGARARVFAAGWQAWSRCSSCARMRVVTPIEVAQTLAGPAGAVTPEVRPVVVDLRERNAFESLHIPGALALPIDDLDARFEALVSSQRPGLRRANTPLVLYCYGRSCVRSREASSFAARHGFLDLWWLRDGLEGWPEEALALVKSAAVEPETAR